MLLDLVQFYTSPNTNVYPSEFTYSYPNMSYPSYTYCYKQATPSFPPLDIVIEKNNKFIEMKMALAGFSKEDITVETEDEYLIISGKSAALNEAYPENTVSYIKQNLKCSEFSRKFEFPDNTFDFKNPIVKLQDGLLTIKIERNPESISEKKKIEIK